MVFVQESIYQDLSFGKWIIRFVVSDVYSDLFKSDAEIVSDLGYELHEFKTNIFQLGKIKESLKKEDGSFAMSELPFKVTTSAIKSQTDKRAFFFCLHANNFKKLRYCASFLYKKGSTFDDTDRTFTGKLSTTISGSENDWIGAQPWDVEINPNSEVDFKALQFDLSSLRSATLVDPVTIPDGTTVDSVFGRLTDIDGGNGDIEKNFKYKPCFAYLHNPPSDGYVKYISPLGTVWEATKMVLDRASEILEAIVGVSFTFDVLETDLGISTAPISYELKDQSKNDKINSQQISSNLQPLFIAPPGSDNYKYNVYMSSFMVMPHAGSAYDVQEENVPDVIKAHESHSFVAMGNVTKLLGEIARSFGCIAVTRFTSGTSIEVEFVSRNTLQNSSDVYLYGVNSSSFDSNSIAIERKIEYYAEANRMILEGSPDQDVSGDAKNTYRYQIFDKSAKDYYENLTPTEALEEFRQSVKLDSLTEYKKLLFSTSWSIRQLRLDGGLIKSEPLNLGDLFETPYESVPFSQYYNPADFITGPFPMLTSGIYIETVPQESEQATILGADTPVWRHATNIIHNTNGKNKRYETLSDYITSLTAADKLFYENTRKVTIPSWNAFSDESDGSNPSWKNLRIGKKIPLKIKVLEYNSTTDEWVEEFSPVQKWLIVGLERSMDKPETTLELIDESVFSIYGNYDETKPANQLQDAINTNILKNGTADTEISDTWIFECNENIKVDFAVALRDDGKIEKFSPLKSKHYNKFIGIAKQDGLMNEFIRVQTGGVIVLENNELDVNKSVFVRHTTGNNPNVLQTVLQEKTVDEDMIFRLCRKPLNNVAFRLEPEYMIYA